MNITFILANILFNQYVVNLIFLTLAGLIIRQTLVYAGQKWANTYHHLATCLLLPGIGYLISSVIKDDIALSLGMIGALSIIRFRNPVKSPFELVIFFALLTLGVTASSMYKLSILLLILVVAVVLGISFLNYLLKKINKNLYDFSFSEGNPSFFLEVSSSMPLTELKEDTSLIYFYNNKLEKEYLYRFLFDNKKNLIKFSQLLENNKNIISIKSDIQNR